MKVVCISDTHSKHNEISNLPDGDMIIHAGDISIRGYSKEIEIFLKWYESLNYKYKILIAGNHDFGFQDNPKKCKELLEQFAPSVIYLENSSVTIEGINIYGSPVQPTFFHWAFNVDRGEDIKQYWDKIPTNTDILITHGPPFGHGDWVKRTGLVGCKDLLYTIELIQPKYNVFGHIHSGHGITTNEFTTFINASILNEEYQVEYEPITFEI